jgi:hypothetical protein
LLTSNMNSDCSGSTDRHTSPIALMLSREFAHEIQSVRDPLVGSGWCCGGLQAEGCSMVPVVLSLGQAEMFGGQGAGRGLNRGHTVWNTHARSAQ